MSSASSEVLVLVNADNTLVDGALQKLLEPFHDPKVGIVGGHPRPVNPKDTLSGFAVYMLWEMHHRISLIYPKIGELIAFRNLHLQLPTDMQSDEDIIRMRLEERGYLPVYAPDAIVLNKGPTVVREFLKQRTRVNIGEGYMKRSFKYDIPTQSAGLFLPAFTSFARDNRRHLGKIAFALGLEAVARLHAKVYVALNKGDMTVWSQVESTKDIESKG